MRWPFANWLRGAPGRDDPSPGARDAVPSRAGPDPGRGSVARPAAWRDMPPLQRAVGATPLTAPSAIFAHDLAGRRAPNPILSPLGHDVTADGPVGLVSGIAVPLVQHAPPGSSRRPAPALPAPAAAGRGRPTARRAATSVAARPSDVADDAAGGSPLGGSAEEALVGLAAGEPAVDGVSLAPRTLAIAGLATATPAISATRVADATAPAPVLALARAVPSGVLSGTSASPSAAADVWGRTDTAASVSTGVPVQRSASVDVTGPASGSVPAMAPAAALPIVSGAEDPAPPVAARRTLGESRRLGLGAPLIGRPPSAASETGRPDLLIARLARSSDAPASTSAYPSIVAAMPASAAASASLPRLVVARRSTTASVLLQVAPELPGAAGPADSDTVVEVSAGGARESVASGAAGSTRPLVGASPLGVSRLAEGDVATDAHAEDAVPVATNTAPAATGRADGPAPGPGSDAGDPAGFAGLAAQGSHAIPPGGQHPQAVGATPTPRIAPARAPLAASRAMRANPPAAMATLGYRPTAEPAPVVARLAIPLLGTGGGGSDTSRVLFNGAARSSVPPALVAAAGRDERQVVSRAALAVGRGAAPAASAALPLGRSAGGTAGPDSVETGPPGGVVSWAAGEGFTSVASPPPPFVQRAVTIDEMTVTPGPDAAGPAGPGAAAGTAGQPGAAGAGSAGTDYEELADHVYGKIRARLTTELLLDRERAGMLVDG